MRNDRSRSYSSNQIDGIMARVPLRNRLQRIHYGNILSVKVHIDNWRWAGVPFYLESENVAYSGNRNCDSVQANSAFTFNWKNMVESAQYAILRLQPEVVFILLLAPNARANQ